MDRLKGHEMPILVGYLCTESPSFCFKLWGQASDIGEVLKEETRRRRFMKDIERNGCRLVIK